jgi:uncharacterized protein
LQAIDIKSGLTFASDWPRAVLKFAQRAKGHQQTMRQPMVVYGGSGQYQRQGCLAVGWREFALAFS